MNLFALAYRPPQSGEAAVRVYSHSYSSYGGNRTWVVKNVLGEWTASPGDKKPATWATIAGALDSKVAGMLRGSGHPVEAIKLGLSNDALARRTAHFSTEVLKALQASTNPEAAAVFAKITKADPA